MNRIFLILACYFSLISPVIANDFKVNYSCQNGEKFEYSVNQTPIDCDDGTKSGCYGGWLVHKYVLDGVPKKGLVWTSFKAFEILAQEQMTKELIASCPSDRVKVFEALDLAAQKPVRFSACIQETTTSYSDPHTGETLTAVRKSARAVGFPLSMALSDITLIRNEVQLNCVVESFQN